MQKTTYIVVGLTMEDDIITKRILALNINEAEILFHENAQEHIFHDLKFIKLSNLPILQKT